MEGCVREGRATSCGGVCQLSNFQEQQSHLPNSAFPNFRHNVAHVLSPPPMLLSPAWPVAQKMTPGHHFTSSFVPQTSLSPGPEHIQQTTSWCDKAGHNIWSSDICSPQSGPLPPRAMAIPPFAYRQSPYPPPQQYSFQPPVFPSLGNTAHFRPIQFSLPAATPPALILSPIQPDRPHQTINIQDLAGSHTDQTVPGCVNTDRKHNESKEGYGSDATEIDVCTLDTSDGSVHHDDVTVAGSCSDTSKHNVEQPPGSASAISAPPVKTNAQLITQSHYSQPLYINVPSQTSCYGPTTHMGLLATLPSNLCTSPNFPSLFNYNRSPEVLVKFSVGNGPTSYTFVHAPDVLPASTPGDPVFRTAPELGFRHWFERDRRNKANKRERDRVRRINVAFDVLLEKVPALQRFLPRSRIPSKPSKLAILQAAISYIHHLEDELDTRMVSSPDVGEGYPYESSFKTGCKNSARTELRAIGFGRECRLLTGGPPGRPFMRPLIDLPGPQNTDNFIKLELPLDEQNHSAKKATPRDLHISCSEDGASWLDSDSRENSHDCDHDNESYRSDTRSTMSTPELRIQRSP